MELSNNDKIMHLDSIREMSTNLYDAVDHIKRVKSIITQTSNKKWKLDEEGRYVKKVKSKVKSAEKEFGALVLHEFIDTSSLKKEIYFAKKIINKIVEKLFFMSEKEDYYWKYCSLKTYKKYLDNFQTNFFDLIPEAELINFLEHELKYLADKKSKPNFNHKTELPDYFTLDISAYLFDRNLLKVNLSIKQKIEFIISEIEKLGFETKIKNGEYILKKIKNIETSKKKEIKEDDVLSISELPEFSLLERHILFKKLGFLDIIESLDTSLKNKNTLSAIILKCSPYSIKKFKYNYYIKGESEDVKDEKYFEAKDVVDDFLFRNKIDINNKK